MMDKLAVSLKWHSVFSKCLSRLRYDKRIYIFVGTGCERESGKIRSVSNVNALNEGTSRFL